MKHLLAPFLTLFVGSAALASPLPEKADLLASNSVVAEYKGTVHQPCHFRTALCPDRCDHAADIAQFLVLENKDYVCNSEYGDEKAEAGSVLMVNATKNIPGQDDAAVHALLAKLKAGDKVHLTVTHYYVQEDGVHYPVRPVVRLEQDTPPAEASEG